MRIAKATLVKRESEDGLVQMMDHVRTGSRYLVDLDSVRVERMQHIKTRVVKDREIVNTVGDGDEGWLPTELLDIEDPGEPSCCGGVPLRKGKCPVCGGGL